MLGSNTEIDKKRGKMNCIEYVLQEFRLNRRRAAVTIKFDGEGGLLITCGEDWYDGIHAMTEDALMNALVHFRAKEQSNIITTQRTGLK